MQLFFAIQFFLVHLAITTGNYLFLNICIATTFFDIHFNGFLIGLGIKSSRFNDFGPFTFDYLLGEGRNFTSPADILFVDHDVPERYIRQLISSGKTVICYVNVVITN